jgi:hypothetical protein
MNIPPARKPPSHRFVRAGLTLLAALTIGLFTAHARAQWIVNDPASMIQDATNFATTVEQYGKEIEQYAKEVAQFEAVLTHYQQQLISLQHMDFLLPPMSNTFTEIPLTQGVEEACPSTGQSPVGSLVSSLLQFAQIDFGQPITVSQQKICQQIEMRKNDKYNLTVRMLNRLKDTYGANVQALSSALASVGTGQGALAGNQANVNVNSMALQTEMQQWQGQILADDGVIGMLEHQQTQLASRALKGSNSILGNVIQAGAFAAAFSN